MNTELVDHYVAVVRLIERAILGRLPWMLRNATRPLDSDEVRRIAHAIAEGHHIANQQLTTALQKQKGAA